MNICKLNKEACKNSFECEWIVGKGCRPRKGAKPASPTNTGVNFTDLPPDVKKLISSKLTGMNAASFRATNKENRDNIPKVTFTDEDYFNLAVKPYAKNLLDSMKRTKGGKSFRQFLQQRIVNYDTLNRAKTFVIDQHVNAVDTTKFYNMSKVMGKNGKSVEKELKKSIQQALDESLDTTQARLPEKPKDNDFKKISSMEELKKHMKGTIVNEYYDSYWYVRRSARKYL